MSSFPASALVLLVLWLGFLVLKVGGAAGGLLGLRRRLVKSLATTMSFPPAIPEQFPKLDRAGLEAFSRDLEGLGFEKLLDAAPVGDAPTHPPTFCRIYAHRRHGCFGVIMQSFPAIGGPIDLRCMINGDLDEGWAVGLGGAEIAAGLAGGLSEGRRGAQGGRPRRRLQRYGGLGVTEPPPPRSRLLIATAAR